MTDIESILNQWGEWQRSGKMPSLKLPGCDLVWRSVFAGQKILCTVYTDTVAEKAERCVLRLDPMEKDLLTEFYVREKNLSVIARVFQVQDETAKGWLDDAHDSFQIRWIQEPDRTPVAVRDRAKPWRM